MQNHNKQDKLYKNTILPHYDVKNVSENAVGNADKDQFCVYDHKRHARGSIIINEDGTKAVCTEDGSWKNIK